jgi:hypothetical protein
MGIQTFDAIAAKFFQFMNIGSAVPKNGIYMDAGGNICMAANSKKVFGVGTPVNGLTAHAGGGQAGATPLTGDVNRVTTVATAADSVLLPAAKAGLKLTVINAAAANSMNVFPAAGDAINAAAANAAQALAAGKADLFVCAVDGVWNTIASA